MSIGKGPWKGTGFHLTKNLWVPENIESGRKPLKNVV